MRAMACAAAALVFAFTAACNDRDRDDTASRIDNAADDLGGYSYERRDEFRRDVRERLDRMDEELAELERDTGEGAEQARRDAVDAARDARLAVDEDVDGLRDATESNWDELKLRVSQALDSVDRQLRALRPDAKPMGGTGAPS